MGVRVRGVFAIDTYTLLYFIMVTNKDYCIARGTHMLCSRKGLDGEKGREE